MINIILVRYQHLFQITEATGYIVQLISVNLNTFQTGNIQLLLKSNENDDDMLFHIQKKTFKASFFQNYIFFLF